MSTDRAVSRLRIMAELDTLEPVVIRACCAICRSEGLDPDDWIAEVERPRWATYVTHVRATIRTLAAPSATMIRRLLEEMGPAGVDAASEIAIISACTAIEEMMRVAATDLPDIYEPDDAPPL